MKRLQCNELKSVFLSSYTPMFNLPLLPLIPLSVFNFHLFHSFILSPCLQTRISFSRLPKSSQATELLPSSFNGNAAI